MGYSDLVTLCILETRILSMKERIYRYYTGDVKYNSL